MPSVLPDAATLVAPGAWRAIDFISDLHLTEATPRTFAAWADYLRRSTADTIVILGDLFEVWVGDDARHEGFEARCVEVLAEASARRPMAFMAGNRDFLVGADLLEACGLQRLEDPTVVEAFGTRVLLSHGDAMCIADVPYQQFRRVVRSPDWQRGFLVKPLAERRALGRAMRSESERQKAEVPADVDVDIETALAAMAAAAAPTLVHGHTHRPGDEALAPGRLRRVLSDWDLDDGDHPRAEVLRWEAAGFTRLAPEAAVAPAR
jgi:UDP-2,3-diacylglucosamine hydrolase